MKKQRKKFARIPASFGFFLALFISCITLSIASAKGDWSCEFMKNRLQDQQTFLSNFQDKDILAEAKAKCVSTAKVSRSECYKKMVFKAGEAGGGETIVPMGTDFDNCVTYYEPPDIEGKCKSCLDMPLETPANVAYASLHYVTTHGGEGADEALRAYFFIMYAHEIKHQEQCLNHPEYRKNYNEDIDGRRKREIEAYETSIQKTKEWLERTCGEERTYCPCLGKERNYATEKECEVECPTGLGCFGIRCTLPRKP